MPRPTGKKLDVILSLRITRDLARRLRQHAQEQDRSMNAQAIRALEAYLANPEEAERIRREESGG